MSKAKKATKKKAKKARKPKIKPLKCKKCGHSFEVGSPEDKENRKKEWTMVSPMPDKNGDVTITLMASWNCPNCGKNITGSAGKTKGDFAGKSRKLLIEEKLKENVQFELTEFAKAINASEENLLKMLGFMMKKGLATGKIEGGKYIPA